MGITLFKDDERYYYRITRSWDNNEYQEYVKIGENESAAYRKAQQIDKRLETAQKAFFLRKQLPSSRLFHPDGSIVGLSKVLTKRKGRKDRWELKLRINIPGEDKPKFTAFGIATNGPAEAYIKAVDRICEWTGVKKGSETRSALLAAATHYFTEKELDADIKSKSGTVALKKEMDRLRSNFQKEAKRFSKRKDVISGISY